VYSETYRSANSVDHESGHRWNANLSASRGSATSGAVRAGYDFGFPLPLPHASLWLYSAAGAMSGKRSDSLANFYFGGFQNNYVDNGEVKRYRDYDSFPGFEIDELSAQSFAKTVLELNLPPLRFERLGTAGFHLSSVRPALFAGVLLADPDRSELRRSAYNIGGQLDFSFSVLHRLPMTLSAGYARGKQQHRKGSSEWMLSLKILGN
jgi:hypothetical protein